MMATTCLNCGAMKPDPCGGFGLACLQSEPGPKRRAATPGMSEVESTADGTSRSRAASHRHAVDDPPKRPCSRASRILASLAATDST